MLEDDTPVQKENWERLKEFDRKYGEKFGTFAGFVVLFLMIVYAQYNKPQPECLVGERFWYEQSPFKPYGELIEIHKDRVLDARLRDIAHNHLVTDFLKSYYVEDDWEGSIKAYETLKEQRRQERDRKLKNEEEEKQKEFERRYELMTRKQAEEREKSWQHFFYNHYGMNEEEIEAWNKAGRGISEPSERVVDDFIDNRPCQCGAAEDGGMLCECKNEEKMSKNTFCKTGVCPEDYVNKPGRGISEPSERVVDGKKLDEYVKVALDAIEKPNMIPDEKTEFEKAFQKWNAKLVYPYTKEGENGLTTIELTEEFIEALKKQGVPVTEMCDEPITTVNEPFYNEQMDLPKEALSPGFKGYKMDPPKDEVHSVNECWCGTVCETTQKEKIAKAFEEWECADGCHKVPNDNAYFGNFDCVCPKIEAFNPNREKTPDNIKEFMEESTTVFGKMEKLNEDHNIL